MKKYLSALIGFKPLGQVGAYFAIPGSDAPKLTSCQFPCLILLESECTKMLFQTLISVSAASFAEPLRNHYEITTKPLRNRYETTTKPLRRQIKDTSKTLLSVKKSFVHALGEKIFFAGKMRTTRILGAPEPGMAK